MISVVLCEILKGERQLAELKAKDEEGTQAFLAAEGLSGSQC